MAYIEEAKKLLDKILSEANVDAGHGIEHAEKVLEHVQKALEYENLDNDDILAIKLAALLHDADDGKFFPENSENQNAKKILEKINVDNKILNLTIKMINLVSYSKNKNNATLFPQWYLLPRYADRLEAMGKIGIKRCYIYTLHKKRPLYTDKTPKPQTKSELEKIVTEKIDTYNGKSESMMDHFYDKLLHLVNIETKNPYILKEAKTRHNILIKFCLEFSKTGEININTIKNLK